MSRLTLRLPDSLHALLQDQSTKEGLSLNQYIIYALTRQTTFTHVARELAPDQVAQQTARFHATLKQLGPPADDKALARFLAGREKRGSSKASAAARAKLRAAMDTTN